MLNYTTKIPVYQSIAEISKMLAKAGAKAVMQEYDNDGIVKSLSLGLVFHGHTIGFRLPINWQAIQSIQVDIRRKITKLERRLVEQEHAADVAWRVIKDWVEAPLALIEANQVKIEQVFLPNSIASQGTTLYEQIAGDPHLLIDSGRP